MKTINYNVTVHSCLVKPNEQMKKFLAPGERYIKVDNTVMYWLLPRRCNCKKQMTRRQADLLIDQGQAELIWRLRRKLVEIDYTRIWMAQQVMVPRVDMISPADLERYIDAKIFGHGNEEAINYVEEIHSLYIENRAKLIVPFKPDPFEGRSLFSFGPDQRSSIAYSDSLKARQQEYDKTKKAHK